jgi:hypothetical protein
MSAKGLARPDRPSTARFGPNTRRGVEPKQPAHSANLTPAQDQTSSTHRDAPFSLTNTLGAHNAEDQPRTPRRVPQTPLAPPGPHTKETAGTPPSSKPLHNTQHAARPSPASRLLEHLEPRAKADTHHHPANRNATTDSSDRRGSTSRNDPRLSHAAAEEPLTGQRRAAIG